jgi:hypothetical protein
LVQQELKKWWIGVLQRGIFFLRLCENKTETKDCAIEERALKKALFLFGGALPVTDHHSAPNLHYTTPRAFCQAIF